MKKTHNLFNSKQIPPSFCSWIAFLLIPINCCAKFVASCLLIFTHQYYSFYDEFDGQWQEKKYHELPNLKESCLMYSCFDLEMRNLSVGDLKKIPSGTNRIRICCASFAQKLSAVPGTAKKKTCRKIFFVSNFLHFNSIRATVKAILIVIWTNQSLVLLIYWVARTMSCIRQQCKRRFSFIGRSSGDEFQSLPCMLKFWYTWVLVQVNL